MAYSKGQIITMNLDGTDREYRILKLDGDIAEVVAMFDPNTSCMFNGDGANTYSGGDLDTYLNTTWYGGLTTTAKNAIVSKTLTQYQYTYKNSVYNETTHASWAGYSTKSVKASGLSRKVYALDVEDIENYFNHIFSTADIWELFWNVRSKPATVTYPWLRSADAELPDFAWCVDGDYGRVLRFPAGSSCAVRPALTIDLSKIFMPQLDAPQNVTASGIVVSFDPVENATSYGIFADGVSIGEYTPQPEPQTGTLTIHFIDDGNINGQVIINDGSPEHIEGTQTKVYENVYSFEVRSYLACDITNQTGSMVGVVEQWTRYEINGDGSATIQFYD